MDETTDECAVRELEEETGLKDVFAEQLQAFSDVDRDPRGRTITVAYYALVNPVGMNVAGYDDAADARWFTLSDMPSLAFDHERVAGGITAFGIESLFTIERDRETR